MVYRTMPSHEDLAEVSTPIGETTKAEYSAPGVTRLRQAAEETVMAGAKANKVLVVDDEPLVRMMLRDLLGILGYEAVMADSGAAAVNLYLQQKSEIGVVILDLFMPGMDGAATFRKLRQLDEGVRVILASGNAHETSIDDLLRAGALGVLSKPFSAGELASAIAGAMATG